MSDKQIGAPLSWQVAIIPDGESVAKAQDAMRERMLAMTHPMKPAPTCETWQDIATVPHDGTWVLCWGPDSLHGLAKFYPNPIWAEYPEYTHWMPLPHPPTGSEQ